MKTITLRLNDIDKQNYNNIFCDMYKLFKVGYCLEYYLTELDFNNRLILSKLRCCNIKIPNNIHRFSEVNSNKHCKLCNSDLRGDEILYLFYCKYFTKERCKYMQPNNIRAAKYCS